MDDEISGVFDDLDPSQFAFPGSAVIVAAIEPTDFDDFIAIHRLMLRTQYAAAPRQSPNPVIFLENRTALHGYVARDGETMTQFAQRLGTEARDMGACRLFFHRRTMLAAIPAESEAARGLSGPPTSSRGPPTGARCTTASSGTRRSWPRTGPGSTISGVFELSSDMRLMESPLIGNQPIELLKNVLG